LKTYRSYQELMTRLFENHPCHTVEYESLANDLQSTLDSIQRFLKVKPRKLFTLLKKQNPENKEMDNRI